MDEFDDRTTTLPAPPDSGHGDGNGDGARVLPFPEKRRRFPRLRRRRRQKRFRIRKLRVLMLLFGLGVLAIVSALFGMLMAVASDLPTLEAPKVLNSQIYSSDGVFLGNLTGSERRIYLKEDDISPVMKHAIISIEDSRFYTNNGVDLRGIARAAVQDVTSKRAAQGASTIPQQFVKLELAAQGNRTVFEKMREAALAYHLSRKWSKDRILRDYLNAIYFGNGAYGIESAARTYFESAHSDSDHCGTGKNTPCAKVLTPAQAALLAGIVQNPSGYDPVAHPVASKHRRDVVLQHMLAQHYITQDDYETAIETPIPKATDLTFGTDTSTDAYFTSWIKPQVVDQLGGGQQGAQRAFGSGLKVKTTINSKMQNAAQSAIQSVLGNPDGPRAALVAIHNSDGEVRAMVGGDNYVDKPFNLATQGQRQPGSSFKPFVLARALEDGISPQSTWESKKKTYILKGGERYTVHNFDEAYAGITTLESATTYSDNSVFVQVGMKVKPARIAALAHKAGIRTPISHNFALPLGGLKEGVTPLDMAHAYETFANSGRIVTGSLSPGQGRKNKPPGPVGIERISNAKGKAVELPNGHKAVNKVHDKQVIPSNVASELGTILQTVVQKGSGTAAQIPGVIISGKTGTTENFGDAWFVGWTKEYTVAVWVGYPDKFKPMKTEFRGGPVSGGTFPAEIWKTFMQSLLKIDPLPKSGKSDDATVDGGADGTPPAPIEGAQPSVTATPPSTGGGTGGAGAGGTTGDGTGTTGGGTGTTGGSGTGTTGGGTGTTGGGGTGTTGGGTGTTGGATGGTSPPTGGTTPPAGGGTGTGTTGTGTTGGGGGGTTPQAATGTG